MEIWALFYQKAAYAARRAISQYIHRFLEARLKQVNDF